MSYTDRVELFLFEARQPQVEGHVLFGGEGVVHQLGHLLLEPALIGQFIHANRLQAVPITGNLALDIMRRLSKIIR